MLTSAPSITCIGSFAIVDLWMVSDWPRSPFILRGNWGGQVIGNDAVIVTRNLLSQGCDAQCLLLDPTEADIKTVNDALGLNAVIPIGRSRIREQTRSLCIENGSGERSWIFSRIPEPKSSLSLIKAKVAYVDYYPELHQFLDKELMTALGAQQIVLFNVGTRPQDAHKLSQFSPIIQISAPKDLSQSEAMSLALRVLTESNASKVVVTLAEHGAVLAAEGMAWYCLPRVKSDRNIIGAGAEFSSEIIMGLLQGYDGEALLQLAVNQTAAKLSS
ncbi:MAG: hypothetical protein WAU88_15535 [Candidatus Zixiibacteriota bacterium]